MRKPTRNAAYEAEDLSAYMKSISGHPILTREQEVKLARKSKYCNKAKEKLIASNLRFVVYVASREFKGYTDTAKVDFLDLIQEGNLGLMRAAEKFDPERGIKFTSFAAWDIRARMNMLLIHQTSLIKNGTNRLDKKLFFKLGFAKDLLYIKNPEERRDARNALVKKLNLTYEEIIAMENRVQWKDVSIDAPIGRVDNGTQYYTLQSTLPSNGATVDEMDDKIFRDQIRASIFKALSELSGREQDVIKKRHLAMEAVTLETLANHYNISRQRVQQIERGALKKLRLKLEPVVNG